MIILKQSQKVKIKWLNDIYNYKTRYNLQSIYKKPSFEKECVYHNLVNLAIKMNSHDYGCIYGKNQIFTFMIIYYDNGTKRIRYFTRYNTYDCEVIE